MQDWLRHQFQNAFLWTPILLSFGAAMYFACPDTVCTVAGGFAAAIFIGAIVARRKIPARAAGAFLFGFLYAVAFTYIVDTPRLTRPLRDVEISGTVVGLDYAPPVVRAYIRIPAQTLNRNAHRDAIVRANIPADTTVAVGDKIVANAFLYPPQPASAPETFDYARWAYFNRLSATGAISKIHSVTDGASAHTMADIRARLHNAADSMLVDTLVLGHKSALAKSDRDIWTAAGIAHIWSISGFHITLVGGWLFAIMFFVFRRISYITRRIPARVPALICAWFGLLFYVGLAGFGTATMRAFLMTSLMFIAFIIGRGALALRNIAIAFCVLFLVNPYSVMQPGFQLSFAAVFGIIWFWGNHRKFYTTRIGRAVGAVRTLMLTTIVATLFTMPFVMAQFHQVPLYGLIGNMILVPIFSFVIMPAVLIGAPAAVIGWHGPVHLAQYVYGYARDVAVWISNLPHANIITAATPNSAVICAIIAMAALMFIRYKPDARHVLVRHANIVICAFMMTVAGMVFLFTPRPVVFVSPDRQLVGFVYDDEIKFNHRKNSANLFAFSTWREVLGQPADAPNIQIKSDNGVWRYTTDKFTFVYIQKFMPLMREIGSLCRDRSVDYIVSYFDIDAPNCHAKILRGGAAIYPSGRVRYSYVPRPWNNQRR